MHKQAINHKQAIIGGGYLFTENACLIYFKYIFNYEPTWLLPNLRLEGPGVIVQTFPCLGRPICKLQILLVALFFGLCHL